MVAIVAVAGHHPDVSKYPQLNDELFRYICETRTDREDSLLRELREETEALGDIARMQISPDQGAFLQMLVAVMGARRVLEIGTFTGYSALCMARSLHGDGSMVCCDSSEAWTAIARRYWDRAGVDDRIRLLLGDARESVASLAVEEKFDLVFIDADKQNYAEYYRLALPRVRQGGLILFDNMLWGGRVVDPKVLEEDPNARAIDALNRSLPTDPRVECMLLAISDGILMARKR